MRPTSTQLLFGMTVWLVLGVTVMLQAPALGQDVAQPPSAGETTPRAGVQEESAPLSGETPPLMAVTVERHGRVLVLNYGPKPGAGRLMANPGPRSEPPGFTIYQGQRQIASGQLEYG